MVNNANLGDILKIRDNDYESFILYRNNMKRLIRELPDNPQQIKEAFSDMVQPEIDRINISLSESKKSIFKSIAKNVVITSGIVSIGLTTGILPNDINQIVGTAGLCGLAQAAITNIGDALIKPNTLRENPYYFLWKVNSKAKLK